MAKKTKNPYRNGSVYFMIFAFVQSLKRSFTKREVIEHVMTFDTTLKPRMIERRPKEYKGMKAGDTLKMSEAQAKASTDVVCGPTFENTGNGSSQGHLYYMDPAHRKLFTADGETVRMKEVDGKLIATYQLKGSSKFSAYVPYKGKVVKEDQEYVLRFRKEALDAVKRDQKTTATAKKTTAKKTAAKKTTAKKTAAKKTTAKKATAKKTTAKKTAAKKTPAKKTTAKRTKKRTAKKTAAKTAPVAVVETPQETAPAVAPAVNETATAATETA